MNKSDNILAIDQGTTSSRAVVFDQNGQILSQTQKELLQIYPANGLVEHNANEIWRTTYEVARGAIDLCNAKVSAIGITNQRETVVAWDRETGVPIHNAIVWQDRRTAATCKTLISENLEPMVRERTGLLLDPYFTATKLRWLLDNVSGARTLAERGLIAAGTIDSFLLWRLTGGRLHATDATNASRTLLFNIHTQKWDSALLELFEIPEAILPQVKNSADDFGYTDTELFGKAIPILGVVGDQQAALIGQGCVHSGMIKSTYGTGCFTLLNTGNKLIYSNNRLLTTVGYRIDNSVCYALEGSIFNAGTTIKWLRDTLGVIGSASETAELAAISSKHSGVVFVPAFTGLGAPHWDPNARGAIYGLTRDTGPSELVRAALEALGYQSAELLSSMQHDGAEITRLRVDGAMAQNEWMLQFLADITGKDVEKPAMVETTALGAARLASLYAGVISSVEELDGRWELDCRYRPQLPLSERQKLLHNWKKAVESTISFSTKP
ncbi:MAG: glycerol kinase [Acidiferrobacteraceae bacterium]|nr:glycerol kinase [Acidiferrobacteraceae bacterium]